MTTAGWYTGLSGLWLKILIGQHCVVVLGNLLTPVCLCHRTVHFGTGQGGHHFGWKSNGTGFMTRSSTS